ncbi:MAG: BamA/TamA family outer membrane protein, partial [Mucilaginibacter sp.]
MVLFTGMHAMAHAQVPAPADSLKADSLGRRGKKISPPKYDLSKQYDFGDLLRNVLHPKKKPDSLHKSSGITIVPNIAANPTIGFQGGIKGVAARRLGDDPNTLLSVGATSASITTKGIIYFYLNHNIFTPGNKWNLQGNFVVAKSVTPDHGFGIGEGKDEGNAAQTVLADPTHKGYAINSLYFNFREKVYKEVAKNLFLGGGLS